jgi:hypothetical protein
MYNQEQYDSSQMNDLIDCVCGYCNKSVQKTKKRVYEVFVRHQRNKIFCCKVCSDRANKKTKLVTCSCCSKVFEKRLSQINENNFCNHSCRAKFWNIKRGINNKSKLPNCFCGKKVKKGASKYCSIQCQQEKEKEDKIELWLKGDIKGYTGQTFQLKKFVRSYLFNISNHKCSKCGWNKINETTKRCPLEINHIDGNASNDRPENLEVLCPNCHALTSNFRALNKDSCRNRTSSKSDY